MSYATRFQDFATNLNAFCKTYGFYTQPSKLDREKQVRFPKKIREDLALCDESARALDEQLSTDIEPGVQKTLESDFESKLLFVVHRLTFFANSGVVFEPEEIDSLEKQLVQLFLKPDFDRTEYDPIVNRRMPSTAKIDEEVGLFFEPFGSELEALDWEIPKLEDSRSPILPQGTFDTSLDLVVLPSSKRSLVDVLENAYTYPAYRYEYPRILEAWNERLERDDVYHQFMTETQKNILSGKDLEGVTYLQDRFQAFFKSDEGFWDMPHYFFSEIQTAEGRYPFDQRELERLQLATTQLRAESDPRFRLKDWIRYISVVKQCGDIEQQEAVHEQHQDRLHRLSQKNDLEGNALYRRIGHRILPASIVAQTAIPTQKPGWLHFDRKRQYKMSHTMSAATIIQDAAHERLKKLADQSEMRNFQPREALNVLSEILSESAFLDDHYQTQRHLWQKKSFFKPGSNRLAKQYHESVLQTGSHHYQEMARVFETLIRRFQAWAQHPDQSDISRTVLMRYQTEFRHLYQAFKEDTLRYNGYIEQAGRKNPVDVEPITFNIPDHSWDQILVNLKRRVTPRQVTKPQETIKREEVVDEKQAALERLVAGNVLEPGAFVLICSNDPDDLSRIVFKRQQKHSAINKTCVKQLQRILETPALFLELSPYFEQVLSYYQSLQEKPLFREVREGLAALHQMAHFQKNDLAMTRLESLLYRFPDHEKQQQDYRASLEKRLHEDVSRTVDYEETFKKALEKTGDSRIQEEFKSVRQTMLSNRRMRYQPEEDIFESLRDLEVYMKSSGQKSTFVSLKDTLELLVWSELELIASQQALKLFDQQSSDGVIIDEEHLTFIREEAWKRAQRSPRRSRRRACRV